MLSLKGTIVTVDAVTCQRDIARRIVDQDGDDVLALKGNQGTLHADVRLFLDDPETKPTGTHTTVDGDHGRIETRTCTVSTDVSDALDTGLDLGDPPLGSGCWVP
jgi:hypothetical protein